MVFRAARILSALIFARLTGRALRHQQPESFIHDKYDARKDIYTADALAWCLYKKGVLNEAQNAIAEAMILKTLEMREFLSRRNDCVLSTRRTT
ncbi:MAG: hypothetical protein JWN60_3259 [Acidobacteria bacterium]|jgi:hypothetical protein|nr:hypothetical protein [Acidobacteriota bacterium]